MSNDMSYKFRKEETAKNGSCYLKGFGRREKPFMTPYEYGSAKNTYKKRGAKR